MEVAPLSDLKIWLLDEEGRRLKGDLYAKVVEISDTHDGFQIRFTGVDPDLAERLGSLH